MEQSWGMDLIRGFFALLDRGVYALVSIVYEIILGLANTTIISSAAIEDLYTRIYTLLGIFMLFKVTFSFINYIINPEQFLDKTKGFQNIIKNVLLVLVMMIITPMAFSKLYEAQAAILDDKLIPNFIFGSGAEENENLSHSFQMSDVCEGKNGYAPSDGEMIALLAFRPFYQINPAASEQYKNNTFFYDNYCTQDTSTIDFYLSKNIYNATVSGAEDDVYTVDYRFFLSTIVGVVVVLMMISFCFDIAIRSFKLAFLQMIAPVPIMSYIDPATSKNGMFSKWLKQIGSTWASLFIRLIALFLAIYMVSLINFNGIGGEHKFWVTLFIMLGALMFAKQIPKLLEELIPGLKMGGMSLNPFKRVANDAIGGKALLGAGAAALGFGAAGIANLGSFASEKWNQHKDKNELNDANQELAEAQNKMNKYKENLKDLNSRRPMSNERYNKLLSMEQAKVDAAQDKVDSAAKKLADNQAKRLEKFSFRHPIIANISQSLTGARMGYKQGHDGKLDLFKVGQESSKVRDYKDSSVGSISERVKDKTTDFFGIKNDSGTTSLVSEELKKKNEDLTRIQRGIEQLNRQFSDLGTRMGPSEFAKAMTMGTDGRYTLNAGYSNSKYLDDIKNLLTQMNAAEDQRLTVTKDINRLQKMKDRKPPGAK